METLADVCRGLDITLVEAKEALAPEDIDDRRKGAISSDTLAAFARSLVQRRERDQGKRPAHYTEQATCKHCGPIWLWFYGEIPCFPWCWNRASDKPEAIARLWDTDRRYYERFLPRLRQTHNDQPKPTRAETSR